MATCDWCPALLPVAGLGRSPKFCSTRCRVAAHRTRRLPRELLDAPRWVRHDRKRPITPAGLPASSTNADTWSPYSSVNRSKIGDGMGFVLGDGIAALDIDHCLDASRRPDKRARLILAATPGAYTEISPSGDGLHIWGTAPPARGRVRDGIEVYSTGRYMTITRNVYRPGGLVDLAAFF